MENIYVKNVLDQVPRLLAQLDRNPYSPTYGCFDWNYWHDKIIDAPSAHTQEHVLVLAYLYSNRFPGSTYYKNGKVRDWAIAAMIYWTKIQHRDGSFDEFYVNERQLGATAITLYAVMKSFLILKDEISPGSAEIIISAAEKSAHLLAGHDETHLLSNHQSQVIMALLLFQKAAKNDFSKAIKKKLKRIIDGQSKDGWFREYAGADLGYLTTTIAFLSEYYSETKDRSVIGPLKRSVEFASHFLYPDGTFGGVIGSRNTAHFWPSGFEIINSHFGKSFPLAGTVAEKAILFLKQGTLLSPEKEDRYFGEQMYDFLLAFLNHSARHACRLPFETDGLVKYFEDSRILVLKKRDRYAVMNAGKGGIIKLFDVEKGRLIKSNCGLIGRLSDGRIISTNYNDDSYKAHVDKKCLSVSGKFHEVSFSNMSPFKMSVFKMGMLVLGRTMSLSNFIKDRIIKKLITGDRRIDIFFKRVISLEDFSIADDVIIRGNERFKELSALDDYKLIFVAYSKCFSISEMDSSDVKIGSDNLERLNKRKKARFSY